MQQDWQAVAAAIAARLGEQGMTMTDLAVRSRVSMTTVRELVHVLDTRKRQPRTLEAISEALGWPGGHLGKVLRGQIASDLPVAATSIAERLDAVEQRLAAPGGST